MTKLLSFFPSYEGRAIFWCLMTFIVVMIGFRHSWHHLSAEGSLTSNMSPYSRQVMLPPRSAESPLVRLYLNMVRDTVCGLSLRTREGTIDSITWKQRAVRVHERVAGMDRPLIGITMIGQRRLDNIEWAIRLTISKNVSGDFIECGVWRGGASVFARAVFKALDIVDRHVWVVDSFQGLPKARTKNDDDSWFKMEYLRVSGARKKTIWCSSNVTEG
jgi:hypothetical protein